MSILTITEAMNRPYMLEQGGVPMFIPSSGSMGNNGAITLTAALDATYANCYLYLPANAIEAGSAAGLYFAQMSSTTVGTVYNDTYSSGKPAIPSSPTAFVTTGPGAYTQVTSEQTLLSFTLDGGALGANGSMFMYPHDITVSNANNKILRFKVGGTAFGTHTLTTSGQNSLPVTFRNKGAVNRNIGNGGAGFGSGSAAVHGTIDTSTNQTVLITGQLANAADYVGIAGLMLQINPSS